MYVSYFNTGVVTEVINLSALYVLLESCDCERCTNNFQAKFLLSNFLRRPPTDGCSTLVYFAYAKNARIVSDLPARWAFLAGLTSPYIHTYTHSQLCHVCQCKQAAAVCGPAAAHTDLAIENGTT